MSVACYNFHAKVHRATTPDAHGRYMHTRCAELVKAGRALLTGGWVTK